ncbi:MAG: hypothetical protein ACMG6H_14210 [Acidobacteriota bacterium]
MKALSASLVAVLVLSTGLHSVGGKSVGLQLSESEPFTATVAYDEATFIIPVGRKDKWKWYLEDTKENRREYTWQVAVDNGNDTYEFGYSLFKKVGSMPESGDLSALIKAGQQSLWQVMGRGPGRSGRVIRYAGISVEPAGENVIIRVKGKENVDRLFSSRPEKVTFEMRKAGKRPTTKTVKVTYKS